MTQSKLPGFPTSSLEVIRSSIKSKLLSNNLGYISWVEGHGGFGSCWGDSREDAERSMWWFVWENYGNEEVAKTL